MTEAEIVARYGWNTTAGQALNPTLSRWRARDALVAYSESHSLPGLPRVWIAAGDPLCAPENLDQVASRFHEEARSEGATVAWFGASQRFRDAFSGTELAIGAQPVWRPADWPGILAGKASLRHQINRAKNKSVMVQPLPSPRARELDPIRLDWLSRRGLPPLHFLAESDVLGTPGPRSFLVARQGDEAVGYLVMLPIPARGGVFIEWIIQSRSAPNGTASLLLDAAFRASAHAEVLTLGMVPLSTFAPLSAPAPPRHIRALLAWMRAHARRFYNFEGLEHFKAKFQPRAWEPLFLLVPDGAIGLHLLHAVADVFAGERSPERLITRALWDAGVEEVRSLLSAARPE